ncbi:uncharacterized protein LY89DRAFT_703179 [Mollisia scopiformis]|uniref:Uncharacterized protein n=1 Tax=Mollisia scopiformis TaxID=149040 RepID=A0A194XVX1_MOLSC|nr:uncharacterized protein LY89DRAFT_703179 [Mollisia scopiformis]KUJ23862.1 hypothetical protein LY89DRAFT_703179 [Mollisia scopiformis]
MVLKRKRSDSDMSSASSLLSSPLSSKIMPIDQFQSYPNRIPTPSLFPSRTRKRHRDNRPSEAEVHQHTLSLLFSAQQSPQPELQPPSAFPSQEPISSLPTTSQSRQQSSLHSFWAIPSTRQSSPSSNSSTSAPYAPAPASSLSNVFEVSNCEDCNAALNPTGDSDAMDVDMMMDIDMNGGNHACTSCGKQVCHSCAVSNLGAERKCLNCAGRKQVWVGGLGWMDQE